MDRRDVDGRQVDRLDDAVGVARGDQRHRRPAPRAGAVVEDPPGRLRPPGDQAPQPGARDEREVRPRSSPGRTRSAPSVRPIPTCISDDRRQHQRAERPDPDQDRVAQLQRQAGVGHHVQEARVGGQPGQVEAGGTRPRRASPRSPSRSTTPPPGASPGPPCRRSGPGGAGSAGAPGWPRPTARAPPAGRPSGRRAGAGRPPRRRLPIAGEEAVERDRLAARPGHRQVEGQVETIWSNPKTATGDATDRRDDDRPGEHRRHPAPEPDGEQRQDRPGRPPRPAGAGRRGRATRTTRPSGIRSASEPRGRPPGRPSRREPRKAWRSSP